MFYLLKLQFSVPAPLEHALANAVTGGGWSVAWAGPNRVMSTEKSELIVIKQE